MSSETMPKLNTGYIPSNDDLSMAYTVSDIINIALAYHNINDDPGEKKYARKIIWGSINKWLETIGPLKYIPGLVEEVSLLVKKKLWETDLGEDEVERLIVDTLLFRDEAFKDNRPEILEALSEVLAARAQNLIEKLGGTVVKGTLVHDIIYGAGSDPQENLLSIVTLIGLALTLSTNL